MRLDDLFVEGVRVVSMVFLILVIMTILGFVYQVNKLNDFRYACNQIISRDSGTIDNGSKSDAYIQCNQLATKSFFTGLGNKPIFKVTYIKNGHYANPSTHLPSSKKHHFGQRIMYQIKFTSMLPINGFFSSEGNESYSFESLYGAPNFFTNTIDEQTYSKVRRGSQIPISNPDNLH